MKPPFFHLTFTLIICVALFATYGVWYAAVSAKSTSVTALQSQIDAKTATMKRLATTRAAFVEMAGDEAVVQAYFVPETGVVAFIDKLEMRGNLLGATINVLSVSTNDTSARPALEFALSVDGAFDAIMRTVGAIEYAPYDITISSLSIGKDIKDVWHADLKISVGSVAESTAPSTP
ncbi:MAG: hypothetical protein PHD04_00635 [Candidatus Pacebacteria bacterium]|nr:hypothetical protein [Candidatus Paceibacterota bacterium]